MAARFASSATDLAMRIPYPVKHLPVAVVGLGELREVLALVPHEEGHDAVVPAPFLGEVLEFGWPILELPRDPGPGHGNRRVLDGAQRLGNGPPHDLRVVARGLGKHCQEVAAVVHNGDRDGPPSKHGLGHEGGDLTTLLEDGRTENLQEELLSPPELLLNLLEELQPPREAAAQCEPPELPPRRAEHEFRKALERLGALLHRVASPDAAVGHVLYHSTARIP
eukprot:scaffold2601_cov198-Pinguiococcus_pyrenoidosus.AAC.10